MTAGCTDEESELWQVFPLEGCRYTKSDATNAQMALTMQMTGKL